MYSVYAIQSLENKRVYIGYTSDIVKRLSYHNSGYVRSTSKDRPWELIASEQFSKRDEARWIEHCLKKSRGKRIKWLERNRI